MIPPAEGIFYTWHQNIFSIAAFFHANNFSLHCIISPSKDGTFIGEIAKKLGLTPLYGSAHKEPIKLVRQALQILQIKKQLFLIGDGSRGPAKNIQPGALYLAQKSNLPLIFIKCEPKWKLTFKKSWDHFQIPLPFSKIYITLHKQSPP